MNWLKVLSFLVLPLFLSASSMNFLPDVNFSLLNLQVAYLAEADSPSNIPDPAVRTDYQNEPAVHVEYSGYNGPGFLDYNQEDHFIYQQSIHGKPITVAWEKEVEAEAGLREEISSIYFDTFNTWWDVFWGFPYESYTVILKANPEFQGMGEHGIGYEIAGKEILGWYVMSEANELNFLQAKIGHEVFHGWNNEALSITSDAENWFREGVTNYYGQRHAGNTEYQLWMDGQLDYYCGEILGTDHDLSLEELGERMEEGSSTKYKKALYYKGALISYLIDLRLDENGLNFDDLLRYLYINFEYGEKQFSNEDIRKALNEISGEDWSEFFDNYIFGTTPLALDGNFQYINHNP